MLPSLDKSDQRAVTLVELMVVLALLTGLSAMALPRFFDTLLPRYRLKCAAQRLTCDMLHVKMRAAATNRQFRIIFDMKDNSYRMESGDRSSQSSTWFPEGGERRLADPSGDAYFPGVRIIAATKPSLIFSPTGGQTAMSITLSHPHCRSIQIFSSSAGRIRMERVGS